ncbi:MAG: anti-sigma factor antagonist [Modestobacter sp.]|jgi:anti-sigma B factor antagonist|nr:anti-sigma factor antagonist [Modestobacter sp.]
MNDGAVPFDVRTEERADHVRLVVTGELDFYREPDLRSALEALLAQSPPQRLVLDIGGLQFLDSAGLRVLLVCRDRCRSADVPFRLAVAPGPVTRLLDLAGVRSWFSYE